MTAIHTRETRPQVDEETEAYSAISVREEQGLTFPAECGVPASAKGISEAELGFVNLVRGCLHLFQPLTDQADH